MTAENIYGSSAADGEWWEGREKCDELLQFFGRDFLSHSHLFKGLGGVRAWRQLRKTVRDAVQVLPVPPPAAFDPATYAGRAAAAGPAAATAPAAAKSAAGCAIPLAVTAADLNAAGYSTAVASAFASGTAAGCVPIPAGATAASRTAAGHAAALATIIAEGSAASAAAATRAAAGGAAARATTAASKAAEERNAAARSAGGGPAISPCCTPVPSSRRRRRLSRVDAKTLISDRFIADTALYPHWGVGSTHAGSSLCDSMTWCHPESLSRDLQARSEQCLLSLGSSD